MILETLNIFALVEKLVSPLGHWCGEVMCEEINSLSSHSSVTQKNQPTVDCLEFYRSPQGASSEWFLRVLNQYPHAWVWLAWIWAECAKQS